MSVDTTTGEIVPSPMSAVEARNRIDRVRAGVETIREDVLALWSGRAWVSLGVASWDALCDAEFGVRLALPRAERVAVVTDLREQGMSTRAIGSALGVADQTVRADLSQVRDFTQSGTVISLDGRRRPATQPRRLSTLPPLTPQQVAEARDEGRRGSAIAGIGMACRELIEVAGDNPEQLVADSPDYMLPQLHRVSEALGLLLRIQDALDNR